MEEDAAPDQATFDVEALFHPVVERSLRRLPRLMTGAVRLVLSAARSQLLLTIALQILGSAALAVQVIVGKGLLTRLLDDNSSRNFDSAAPWTIALVAALAVASVTGILRVEIQRLLGEMVARYAMRQVIEAAGSADLARFESPSFHDRLQRAIVNASIRPLQMTTGLMAVAGSGLATLAVGVALATIEPLFLLLGLLAAIPLTLSSLRVGRALYQFAVDQTPTDRERTYIQTLLVEKDPAKEIRAYDLGPFLQMRFARLYDGRIEALRRLIRRRSIQGVFGGLATAVASGATLGLLILFVSDRRVSLAGAGAAAAALILLGTQLQGLAYGLGQLYESALFIQDFDNFIRLVPDMTQFRGGAAPPARVGHVSVRNLGFTYPSRTVPSITDVHLDIRPGEVVALVGENGSGKTTLAKLLAGLYVPQAGSICWDGQDLATMDMGEARSHVAVLFQDFVRYALTGAENVAMGRWRDAGDVGRIRRAAERSGADTILAGLPNGYETYLGPQFFGGSDLSGGQWQRVALARAFFRDADLVILDEPTAALDPRAEAALFSAVRDLFTDRSILLISHRFASVRLADYIYVLDGGRVAEHGRHEDLMRRGGVYAELFTLQSAAFGLDAQRLAEP